MICIHCILLHMIITYTKFKFENKNTKLKTKNTFIKIWILLFLVQARHITNYINSIIILNTHQIYKQNNGIFIANEDQLVDKCADQV